MCAMSAFFSNDVQGLLSALLSIVGFIFYFNDLFHHRTKPHAFSWFLWSLIAAIAFAAQLSVDAGPGSWVQIVEVLGCFGVFVIALKRGETDFVLTDWVSLMLALLSLLAWYITADAMYAVILICFVEFFAFVPTVRKTYAKPHEETLLVYAFSVPKFGLSFLAMNTYSITSALYPGVLVIMNAVFVLTVLVRRRIEN